MLGEIIKKSVSSNFMGMVISASVIFDNGYTYSCFSKKEYLVKLEDKTFPRNLKGIAKYLEIYGYGIVKYSVRSEIGCIIVLRGHS